MHQQTIVSMLLKKNRSYPLVFLKLFSLLALSLFFHAKGYGQAQDWSVKWNYPKVFIENKGQFDGRDKKPDSQILYAVDHTAVQVFFTREGLTYRLDTKIKNKNRKKGDTTQPKRLVVSDFVYMTWEGANPDPQIIPENLSPDYHTYSMLSRDRKSYYDIRNIKGYKKITYKNLYPAIDVEYVFHPESGIKYALVLHPGADISKVRMKFVTDSSVFIDKNGNLKIATIYGDITEHAPVSFYSGNNTPISSHFQLYNNEVSFVLGDYDHNQKVVIDPWVQTPTLANSNGVWELDKDGAGNIYTIGGDMPMKLQKWSAAGVLQWTYNTPWDTANNWLGTLTTDQNGNSYITSGSEAVIQRVNSSGSMVWSANGGAMDEYWMIAFNCDQTKLIVGGTRVDPLITANSHGVIFDINTSNGSVISLVNVAKSRTYTLLGMPVTEPNEVRALSSSRDAKYYFLTLDSVGAITQNMNLCSSNGPVFKHISGYNFSYKCENYRPNNSNSGIRSVRANNNFVYTQNGTTLHKRSLADGSVLTTVTIPGGISSSVAMTNFNQPGNSGIAVDDCGNVYVGSGDRVIKYDANLNQLSQTTLPFAVFDVVVAPGGNVVVCGATGNSSSTSRTGYVQSINMSACAPFALICCNTTICPAGPFCSTDSPVTLICETPGGTWSGTGVDPSTGVFNPSSAGAGTHTITYTLPCGSSSITIVVSPCVPLNVCQELNGDMTVSGGTAPYSWQQYNAGGTITITNQAECQSCGYTWNSLMGMCMNGMMPVTTCTAPGGWVTFATGTTVTPPGTWPIRVIDSNGDSAIISSLASLPACSPCPTLTITTSNIVNVCGTATNGSFTATTSGGDGPYDYTLTLGATTFATFNDVGGPQNFTGLGAGTYTLTVVDANNCQGTTTITISSASNLTPVIAGPTTICAGSSATLDAGGPYAGYSWSSGATTQTITISASGTYSVTVSDGGCTGSTSISVTQASQITPSITGQTNICPGTSTVLDAGSGYASYQWSNGTSSQTATVSTGGAYSVTVSDGSGCTGSASINITVISTLPVTATATPGNVCPGNPVTLTATGGGTYLWNTTPPSYDSVFVVHPTTATTYVVTVTYNGCSSTSSVSVSIDPSLSVTASSTNTGCINHDGTATVEVSGPGYNFIWNTVPPQYTQTATGLAAGTYIVTVGYNGCSGSTSVTVNVASGPEAAFYYKPESPVLDDGPVFFFDQSWGNITNWYWDFGDSTDFSGIPANHSYADTGSYLVTMIVTDTKGCKDTARGTIYINPLFTVWIPNSFTPNDDFDNEEFKPLGVGWDTKNYFMAIYDRWGKMLFYTEDINEGWNGTYNNAYDYSKGVQSVFAYVVQVADLKGIKHKYKGIVVVVQ
ncbi:MAG TPA: gliding motility-associated C-terminal domain-containing protein [Bacteroidales bacterium]|mgnify:FL=1|nr:gliding motility-associated C-terminal domain-containing protein [Bacteroidales bacterium]HPB24768.1 gliding motility-associated C-terminal domain-containing protein [Bacteroidales bacterium]